MDYSFLNDNKIVPVVVIDNLEDTLTILGELKKGGINSAEITFRTDCAKDAIALAVKECKDMVIGAGTVITGEQCETAISAGAKFIVSPGFSMEVYEVTKKYDIPYLPGVVTPTEIITARNLGLKVLKFFPAGVFGGAKALKALSSVFRDVEFLPTGGVDELNMDEFFAIKSVKAIGGSFMFKKGIDHIAEISKKATDKLK